MTRLRRTIVLIAIVGGVTSQISARTGAQVPAQDRQPAGAALRPAVAGPSGGVSTGIR